MLPTICALTFVLSPSQEPAASAKPKLLFLTHSAGYVHDVVRRPTPDELAPAERALTDAARDRFDVVCTQDCASIDGRSLEQFDAVVFYTTGELPIPDERKHALMRWLQEGGAFVGIHCATDTLYRFDPYVQMIGGTFDGHPWHEEIDVRVEDRAHPATASLGERFAIADEIYQFANYRRHPLHVLLSLDLASVDASLGKRIDGDYALAWCREWGRGKTFYTALGHRLEVWRDPRFLAHLLGGIDWAIRGEIPSRPPPQGAFALLDTGSLGSWSTRDGKPAGFEFAQGIATVGGGDVVSKEVFGDALIHVEFNCPDAGPEKKGQARGNSGVYVHGRYELQVLDSFGVTPGLGDCGAIYGKRVPDLNASKPPGEWQTYDIEFRAPRFDANGQKTESARASVWLNGIPIHRDVAIDGPTGGALDERELATGPLMLQDHGDAVRYRNAWILPRR